VRWALWTAGGILYRVWRLEIRADLGTTLGDRGPDLATALAAAFWWP
jgi:hypothetical protein